MNEKNMRRLHVRGSGRKLRAKRTRTKTSRISCVEKEMENVKNDMVVLTKKMHDNLGEKMSWQSWTGNED